jgi:hypothetical protein
VVLCGTADSKFGDCGGIGIENRFQVIHVPSKKSFVLVADSAATKKLWIEHISTQINSACLRDDQALESNHSSDVKHTASLSREIAAELVATRKQNSELAERVTALEQALSKRDDKLASVVQRLAALEALVQQQQQQQPVSATE